MIPQRVSKWSCCLTSNQSRLLSHSWCTNHRDSAAQWICFQSDYSLWTIESAKECSHPILAQLPFFSHHHHENQFHTSTHRSNSSPHKLVPLPSPPQIVVDCHGCCSTEEHRCMRQLYHFQPQNSQLNLLKRNTSCILHACSSPSFYENDRTLYQVRAFSTQLIVHQLRRKHQYLFSQWAL